MRSLTARVFQGAFGALVVGALGFGATQAAATPGAARDATYCTREDVAECGAACQEALGPGWWGRCTTYSLGQKSCQCIQIFPPGGTPAQSTSPDSRSGA